VCRNDVIALFRLKKAKLAFYGERKGTGSSGKMERGEVGLLAVSLISELST